MNKDIKLIVTDLDGALVDSSSKLILENKNVLKILHDKGIRIAIATGRPFNAFWWIRQELGLNLLMIIQFAILEPLLDAMLMARRL